MNSTGLYATENENDIKPVTEPGDLNNPPGTGADEADFEDDDVDEDDDDEDALDDEDDEVVE